MAKHLEENCREQTKQQKCMSQQTKQHVKNEMKQKEHETRKQ